MKAHYEFFPITTCTNRNLLEFGPMPNRLLVSKISKVLLLKDPSNQRGS